MQVRVRDAKAGPALLHTPSDLKPNAVRDLSGALNILLSDMFALYLKTKNLHWHMSGPHFRDYHLLLDEQGDQISRSPNVFARSAARRYIRSATSAACNASRTTIRILLRRWICSPNCAMTPNSWWQTCAKRMAFARSTTIACWKSGSMRPSGAHGSCSRPRGGLSPEAGAPRTSARYEGLSDA